MATTTTNLGLSKPEYTDTADIAVINGNMDVVDASVGGMAAIVNGKQSTVAVSKDQYVLLVNSTITGLTDGAYTAAKAIPANTDLDSTYLTAVSSGGIANALNSKCPDLKITEHSNSNSLEITLDSGYTYIIFAVSGNSTHQGMWIVLAGTSDAYPFEIEKGSAITLTSSGLKLTFTHSSTRNTRYTFIRCAVY